MLRFAAMLLLFSPLLAYAQSYGDSPFYKAAPGASGSGAAFRWRSPDTRANGTSTTITMSANFAAGIWEEGLVVDGNSGAQTIHWYAQFDRLNITFGYNLLLQPIPGTEKVRCTFNALSEPFKGFRFRNRNSYLVPLPEPLSPLIILNGETIAIRMLPDKPTDMPFTQYLHVQLDQTEKRSSRAILGTTPASVSDSRRWNSVVANTSK